MAGSSRPRTTGSERRRTSGKGGRRAGSLRRDAEFTGRRAGSATLHGRPLDENGAIAFTVERTDPSGSALRALRRVIADFVKSCRENDAGRRRVQVFDVLADYISGKRPNAELEQALDAALVEAQEPQHGVSDSAGALHPVRADTADVRHRTEVAGAEAQEPTQPPEQSFQQRLNAWREVGEELERTFGIMGDAWADDAFPDWFKPRVLELLAAEARIGREDT